MKKALIFFYSLFSLGFLLKFFHIHYNAILMLLALGGILVLSLISLFKKENRDKGILHIGISAWLLSLLISMKFFPFGQIVLIFACIFSVSLLAYFIRKRKLMSLTPLAIAAAIAIAFYIMPSDFRYYILNVKWNHEIENDFITLDKYSWFLYQNGKDAEALTISDQALAIAVNSNQTEWVARIEGHNLAIRKGEWKNYP